MASTLKIGGTTISPSAASLCAYRLTAYSLQGGRAAFEFAARTGALRVSPDPYLGQAVELWIDGTLRFAGDISSISEPFDSSFGWVQMYRCEDLRARADQVPVTDPTARLDSIAFGLHGDDLDWRGSRAGRTLGYICKYALEAPDTSLRLDDLGIGGYSSQGWGAQATATVSGGGVTVAIDDGGANYSIAPAVVLVGGDGAYTSATATVSGGAVTGISVSGASGWTEAPEVWIGTLPEATLRDLARLTFVSPAPVTVAGEYILGAIEGLLRSLEPNVVLVVQPDGTLRFPDLRTFGGPRVVIEGDGVGATATATVSGGAVTGVTLKTAGAEYTSATARVVGGGGSGCTLSATVSGGAVTGVSVSAGGTGYAYPRTLTLGTDPIEPFSLQRDVRGCFSRVIVRGEPEAEMVELRKSKGDITEDFTWGSYGTNADAKAAWAINDYEQGGRDSGTVNSATSLTVTIESDDAALTWGANDWDQTNRRGNIFLRKTVISGVESYVTRRVVSNTALAAAGTSVLTLDRPLPATNYTSYTLTGLGGGAMKVWRQYKVADADVAAGMLQYASYPLPIRNADGSAARMSSVPTLVIQYSDAGTPPYFESPMGCTVDPDTGVILADKPVVTLYGNRSNLIDGGASTDGIPADVVLYVPINKGDMAVTVPPDESDDTPMHAGTSHTDYGVSRTLIVSMPGWRDPGQAAAMREYAESLWWSVADVPIEGSVMYLGLYSEALSPGLALNLAGTGYGTGWESAALPVVECEVIWQESAPFSHTTRLALSSRRQVYSAANFLQPEPTGEAAIGAGLEGLNAGGLSAGVGLPAIQGGFIAPSQWGATGPGAQAVLRMSAALRSGEIGPLGAAVQARNNLLGTATWMAQNTFGIGGNGGGGLSPRAEAAERARRAAMRQHRKIQAGGNYAAPPGSGLGGPEDEMLA